MLFLMTHLLLVASILPIKTLVARELPTSTVQSITNEYDHSNSELIMVTLQHNNNCGAFTLLLCRVWQL